MTHAGARDNDWPATSLRFNQSNVPKRIIERKLATRKCVIVSHVMKGMAGPGDFDCGQRSRPDVLASGYKCVQRIFQGFFFFFGD